MKLDHIALWAEDTERLRDFYVHYFNAVAGDRYHNPVKRFTSYFLLFPDGDTRLEIMNVPDIIKRSSAEPLQGYCHICISVGSKEKVDELTEILRSDGITVIGNPRLTGDGYYESVIVDPEHNIVEITI